MNNAIKAIPIFVQCGIFILVPGITFGIGLHLIRRFAKKKRKLAAAGLIGLTFFETSLIGLIFDPKVAHWSITAIVGISAIVGLGSTLLVLAFLPIATILFRFWR